MPDEASSKAALGRAEWAFLAIVVLLGAALRVYWNDVSADAVGGDETLYRNYTQFLFERGWAQYPSLVANHIQSEVFWKSPSPLRFVHFGLTTAACHVASECNLAALTGLSTVAGIASILLAFGLSRAIAGNRVALLAAAFTATSPLQLAMGRRGLQEEVFCAVVLAAIWSIVRVLRTQLDDPEVPVGRQRLRYLLAIALMTTAFGIKESFLFLYPALAVPFLYEMRRRPLRLADAVLFAAPGALYYLGFCAATRNFGDFFALARIIIGEVDQAYALIHQAGPPHRILFDLLLLAPIVSLLATGAVAIELARPAPDQRRAHWLLLMLVTNLVALAFLESKNVRYSVTAESLLRIAAAWTIVTHYTRPRGWGLSALAAVAILNALAELWIFQTIFIEREVYDPVTSVLIDALGMGP